MSKEYMLQFNDKFISIEEQYQKDNGTILFGETNNDKRLYILYDSHDNKKIEFFIELIKYVADLETKLAEKEQYLEDVVEVDKVNYEKLHNDISQLKKQLAKKEKEIDKLEDKLHHYYEETLNNGTCGLCEHLRGEYKTDFAIEQLEKVKELIRDNSKATGFVFAEQTIDVEDFEKIIDQQIKKLKEF